MNGILVHIDPERYQGVVVWIISLLLVATALWLAKDVISFVLMKLYELFIQQNSSQL